MRIAATILTILGLTYASLGYCGGVPNVAVVPDMRSAVINLAQREIFLFDNGTLVGIYPVAVGKPSSPTPVGKYRISSKREKPTWYVPESIQEEMADNGDDPVESIPPGPNNPLGDYILKLSGGTIGIHGTNKPSSISKFVSHGCIRMKNEDVAQVFQFLNERDPVQIVDQPLVYNPETNKVEFYLSPYMEDENWFEYVNKWLADNNLKSTLSKKQLNQLIAKARPKKLIEIPIGEDSVKTASMPSQPSPASN